MTTLIKVKFDFEGFHLYSGAPKEVEFLKTLHRHMFVVYTTVQVFHDDRELEFIMLKRKLQKMVVKTYPKKIVGSCEMVAKDIYSYIKNTYGNHRYVRVEVYEDDENGGIVTD